MKFNDNYHPLKIGKWELLEEPHHILKNQRESLGMTKQQVADKAHILFKQYSRLETGERTVYSASFRIIMSICYALQLDPRRLMPESLVASWHD